MDEADHVVTHRGTIDTIYKSTCLKSGILGLEIEGKERERERERERDREREGGRGVISAQVCMFQ